MYLPTIPYSLVDAVNRCAAATGSVSYAKATSHADYNGHHVRVYYNAYRNYFLTEYQWGERVVLCRGSLRECLLAGKRYYEQGALGSTVRVNVPDEKWTEEDRAFALSLGYKVGTREEADAADAVWRTPLYSHVGWAVTEERQYGIPAVHFLLTATSEEDYAAKKDAYYEARRARRAV